MNVVCTAVVTRQLDRDYHHHHHHHHHHHPYSLLYSSLAASQKSAGLTNQALLIHCSAKNFLTVRHTSSIAAFCNRIHIEQGGE
jgi:hypothetical protein